MVTVSKIIWKHEILWIEMIPPLVAPLVMILIFGYLLVDRQVDVNYKSFPVEKVVYYEPWDEYVSKTCYRQYCTGTGKNRTCYTVPYDCSYVDYHPEQAVAITNEGYSKSITVDQFEYIARTYGNKKFIELNRDYHNTDGDSYESYRNSNDYFIPIWFEYNYVNPILSKKSLLNQETSKSLENKLLFTYPNSENPFIQYCILANNVTVTDSEQWHLERINSRLEYNYKGRVYLLLWRNQPISISYEQENKWNGGNYNEVVVCASVDDEMNIQWCRPFSLSGKTQCSKIKQAFVDMGKLNIYSAIDVIEKNMDGFTPKNMDDYSYIKPEMSTGAIIGTIITTILVTGFIILIMVINEHK